MSSKPDKKHEENIEDTSKNFPGQDRQPGQQGGQAGQKEKQDIPEWHEPNPRGGEQRGGQDR